MFPCQPVAVQLTTLSQFGGPPSSLIICFGHKIKTKRSRRIGQSYLSAVWTTLTGILSSISIIISHRPQICLTNGPAISVTTCIAIRCLNLLTLFRYKCQIIYVESFCQTRTLSLSGKIIYYIRLADQFYVRWPTLADRYHRSLYKGILV